MSNLSRTIRRNKARLLIGEYEARRNKKKKNEKLRIIPGKSKVLCHFWEKIRRAAVGDDSYILSYVRCNPGKRHKISLVNDGGGIIKRRSRA